MYLMPPQTQMQHRLQYVGPSAKSVSTIMSRARLLHDKLIHSGYYLIVGVAFHLVTQNRLPVAIDPIHHSCPLANYLLQEEYCGPRRTLSICS